MAPGRSATSLSVRSPLSVCALCALLYGSVRAGLYSSSDQIAILNPDNVDSLLFQSASASLVEFYASWCGHCISFSPVWKKLARDVREWKPVVKVAAIDCADEKNRGICTRFKIYGYPSLKFFPAFSSSDHAGQNLIGFPRDVPSLRQLIIDKLKSHKEAWPPTWPSLEPISLAEVVTFGLKDSGRHLALVFEEDNSYVGSEVILDLVEFENLTVRRVLRSEETLVSQLSVTNFPSCYLYYTQTNFSRVSVVIEGRVFYSYALRRLPGVARAEKSPPDEKEPTRNQTEEPWRPFNRTRVYMADLESALHYSLRVEVAARPTISGDALFALRSYVNVLAKYFPGRPPVKGALKAVDDWLQEQKGTSVNYGDFRAALDIKSSDSFLPEGVRWVACQGSKPHYRGYPCAMWTLFHTLTVQADELKSEDPQEVLLAMRQYVYVFFGCRECAHHFESMAQDGMDKVTTLNGAILWLWLHHNRVNNRLAGALSEDPHFPKLQWPPPVLCPACHGLKSNGEHAWVNQEVLNFLKNYYSARGLLNDYVSDAVKLPPKDRETASEVLNRKEGVQEKVQVPVVIETEVKAEPEDLDKAQGIFRIKLHRPRDDLDSFVMQSNKAKAGKKKRDTQEDELSKGRRPKRDLVAQEAGGGAELAMEVEPEPYARSQSKRWVFVLGVGFSRLDVSLCVVLYLLSTLCILAMYLYVRVKWRLRMAKVGLP